MSNLKAKQVQIKGKSVFLSQVKISDAKTIALWKNEHTVNKFALSFQKRITVASQCAHIKQTIKRGEPYFLIRLVKTLKPVGYIRFCWLDAEKTVVWLSYAIGEKKYRQRGYCFDALSALINYFLETSVRRFEAECYDFNTNSVKLLKKLGFKLEGRKRKAGYSHHIGKYHDIFLFGLLVKDFCFHNTLNVNKKRLCSKK